VARRINEQQASNVPDKRSMIFQFNISKDLKVDPTASTFVLQPFDRVYIRRAPGYLKQSVVTIEGEVVYPGIYSITDKNESISDILFRAGGITAEAYPKGAKLLRLINADTVERKKTLANLKRMSFDSSRIAALQEAKTVLVIDLDRIMKKPKSEWDIALQNGDKIVVPKEFQSVRLSGAVTSPVLVRYQKGQGLKKYVSFAGGFLETAKESRTYVIYPNGSVRQTGHFWFLKFYPKIEPGSEIIVPLRPARRELTAAETVGIFSAITSTLSLIVLTIVSLK